MSAICQVTGRKPGYGKSVSHSHRRTSRRWNPNVQRRKFYLPSEGRTITLKSTAGTGYTYVTRKNKRNNPDRITLKKYDPVIRKHVEFREER